MADRVITWSLASLYKNGAYNSTFRFDMIQPALDHMARYWQLAFPRVTRGARLSIIQANTSKNPTWAAWTNGNTIYISPTFNFGRNARICAKVILHEFAHAAGGGSHSSNSDALMAPNGGNSEGWIEDDLRWLRAYKLRGGMPPRGSLNEFRSVASHGSLATVSDDIELKFGCNHWSISDLFKSAP
jgi:hypothetical protein